MKLQKRGWIKYNLIDIKVLVLLKLDKNKY